MSSDSRKRKGKFNKNGKFGKAKFSQNAGDVSHPIGGEPPKLATDPSLLLTGFAFEQKTEGKVPEQHKGKKRFGNPNKIAVPLRTLGRPTIETPPAPPLEGALVDTKSSKEEKQEGAEPEKEGKRKRNSWREMHKKRFWKEQEEAAWLEHEKVLFEEEPELEEGPWKEQEDVAAKTSTQPKIELYYTDEQIRDILKKTFYPPENLELKHLVDLSGGETSTVALSVEFPQCPFVPIDNQRKTGRFLLVENPNFESGLKNKDIIQSILEKNNLKLDLSQAISLRPWVLRIHAAEKVQDRIQKIFNSFTLGKTGILELSKLYNLSPLFLFKEILYHHRWTEEEVKIELTAYLDFMLGSEDSHDESLYTPQKRRRYLSRRDKEQFLIAYENDGIEPLSDNTIENDPNTEVAKNVAKFFQSQGVEFYTKEELIAHQHAQMGGVVATPDLLVKPHQHVTVKLNGHERRIHWIEIKMTYGSDIPLQQEPIYKQISHYKKHFGFGLLVFNLGCVDKIFEQYLKEDICLCVDSRIISVE